VADDLDRLLRDAFRRAAEDGDPAGVADVIRSRVASGDPGASVAGSTAPGWGGGLLGWLTGVGVVVLGGAVGLTLGATGIVGADEVERPVVGHTAVLDGRAPVAACPGGPVVGSLPAGMRVLAVERSDEGFLGVRDPNDASAVLWLAAGDLVVDGGQPDAASLPLGEPCPEVSIAVPQPEPETDPEPQPPVTQPKPPAPKPDPEPPQPGDTVPPVLQQWWAAPKTQLYLGDSTTIHLLASDDVGVTAVSITWSGTHSGSGNMTKVGSEWRFDYTNPVNVEGQITFTMKARDAAGNHSTTTLVVSTKFFG